MKNSASILQLWYILHFTGKHQYKIVSKIWINVFKEVVFA